jgi:hypothetical protein
MKDKPHFVRNRTKAIIGVSLAVLLTSGCTSMLSHARPTDEAVGATSALATGAEICGNRSYLGRGVVSRFLSAVEERLSYSVYNEALWEQVKQQIISDSNRLPPERFKEFCAYISKGIVGATRTMVRDNRRMAAARSRDLTGMSNGLQQLGSALSRTPSYQTPQIPLPKIQPTNTNQSNVTPLYSAADCIGSSVNGMCYGTVLPNAQPTGYCRGTFTNGYCSGPVTTY